ncbi:Trafficking protein particle complex subunit 2-like protein like [Verticillium longisporum]|uniref:Trafficking protein particle complex subunit 2-like protein like n=1 Tax=Verticillium longisporum TaxID=100787 RepID=A0A8I2Z609_VERLO|nr:Trafficking protein particle complex subunit 2-like protein like [Verticillium longisporum]KAG7110186.1 Trafficking protein particle complex subunit 2-like protein like [Verticillium longisporum]
MATAIPSIACIGIIGRENNPLHVSIFPSFNPQTNTLAPLRTPLQFSLLLSSTLDVFELRARHAAGTGTGLSGDFGLLHAVDERLAAYGFETNTGVKIVVVVDMRGRSVDGSVFGGDRKSATGTGTGSAGGGVGLRDGELKVVFRAVQSAYVRLVQNPFFEPDEVMGKGGKRITSRKFDGEIRRIGEGWTPGVTSL